MFERNFFAFEKNNNKNNIKIKNLAFLNMFINIISFGVLVTLLLITKILSVIISLLINEAKLIRIEVDVKLLKYFF